MRIAVSDAWLNIGTACERSWQYVDYIVIFAATKTSISFVDRVSAGIPYNRCSLFGSAC